MGEGRGVRGEGQRKNRLEGKRYYCSATVGGRGVGYVG